MRATEGPSRIRDADRECLFVLANLGVDVL